MATSAVKSGLKPLSKVEPAPAASQAPEAPASKKRKLVFAMLLLLLIGGGAAWYYLSADAAKAPAVQVAKAPVFATLEPFTLNLQPEASGQYLQISITLQVPEQAQADLIKQYAPLVRNRILVLLSAKNAVELSSVAGKQKLMEEIAATLQKPFAANAAPQKISHVLFTAFVIQ